MKLSLSTALLVRIRFEGEGKKFNLLQSLGLKKETALVERGEETEVYYTATSTWNTADTIPG